MSTCPPSSTGWARAASPSSARRGCRRGFGLRSIVACSRSIARRPRPASRCSTAPGPRCSRRAFPSVPTPISRPFRGRSWTACCSSRTGSSSSRARRDAIPPWNGTAWPRRSGPPWGRGQIPASSRPAAARSPPRSRSTAMRRPGRTEDVSAKLRQMVSASLRAYRDGPDTSAARRQIVVDYLNSTPLSARAGFGEVNGLGDGLWAWFGTDFEHANQVLGAPAPDAALRLEQARIYKQALSLLLAQRRPSYYLLAGRAALGDAHRQLPPPARRERGDRSRAPARRARSAPRISRERASAAAAAVRRAQGGERDSHVAAEAAGPAGALPARPARPGGDDVARSVGPATGHRAVAASERSAGGRRDGPLRPPPARRRRVRRAARSTASRSTSGARE